MKSLVPLCLGLGFLLAGCGEKADKPVVATNAASGSGSLLTAPVDYLKSATDAKHSMAKTIDTTSLEKAVQLFNVDQGRNPKDLAELVEKKYIPQIPEAPYGSKLVYDAAAGTVKVVNE